MKFKVGDRVKLKPKLYTDSSHNPSWGGKYGKIVGTITSIRSDPHYQIQLCWNNREINIYKESDLDLIDSSLQLNLFREV